MFCPVTTGWGRHGAIVVRLSKVKKDLLGSRLADRLDQPAASSQPELASPQKAGVGSRRQNGLGIA